MQRTEARAGGRSAARRAGDEATEAIATELLSAARVVNQLRVHERFCRQAGVDVDRLGAAVLFKLHTEGDDVRLTELADRLGIDPPGVTRKVQQLEREHLVERGADPADARATRLRLTPAGTRAITLLLDARRVWLEELLSGWSEPDRTEFARLLGLFARTLADHPEPPHGH